MDFTIKHHIIKQPTTNSVRPPPGVVGNYQHAIATSYHTLKRQGELHFSWKGAIILFVPVPFSHKQMNF